MSFSGHVALSKVSENLYFLFFKLQNLTFFFSTHESFSNGFIISNAVSENRFVLQYITKVMFIFRNAISENHFVLQ